MAHEVETLAPSAVGIPYSWLIEVDAHEKVETPPDHVGAWSWDEDGFPETAKGWTHTSKWLKLDLTETATVTLTMRSQAGVPWPSAEDPKRVAATNLFPSITLYQGWDTDVGLNKNADGTTVDQDHTYNNRGNIEWAEDVVYLAHAENATSHTLTRTWVLPQGHYTIALGGNSPAVVAEGRQGFVAVVETRPTPVVLDNALLVSLLPSTVGIPYLAEVILGDRATAQAVPDHVGAWSWDEDSFPETAKGWTHTSSWLKLTLKQSAFLTLTLESRDGVSWPSPSDPSRVAGTNLFPSFTLYRGWDTDAGVTKNPDGTTLDQDHTYNNRGDIAWAEDVRYLDHVDNSTQHKATRTWSLAAGEYTLALGGNSPSSLAEGRQGYLASLTTTPVNGFALETHSGLQAVDASGLSTWKGTAPFSVVGVLLNDPEEFLDATPDFAPWQGGANLFRLGGQWQIFVQSVDPLDKGGTAAWMGQNYGNLPFIHDSEMSYSNDLWKAEIERIEHDARTGRRFRRGDLIRVNAARSLDFAGKRNINEAHELATEADFSVELVTPGYGLPEPETVTLADLVSVDDGKPSTHEDIFDLSRARGGERWQSRRIRINNLKLVDGAGWGKVPYFERISVVTDGAGRFFRVRTPSPALHLGSAPSGTFDAIGILDQDSASGLDGTFGYELFVQEIVRETGPRLSVRNVPSGIVVSWVGSAAGFQLYEAATVAGPWTLASAVVETRDQQSTVTIPRDGQARFFQLRR